MQMLHRNCLGVAAALLFFAFFANGAAASTITLSLVSSDETPAGDLDATFDFVVVGTTLFLTVTNDTTAPDEFNINEIYFNASSNVTGLTFVAADHSVEGLITGAWAPLLTGAMVNGFDVFDFGLADGMGENDPSTIGPTENIEFEFSISGTGPFTMADFATPNIKGLTAAAKFVSGPGDDSAFGAVPEPATAGLLGLGLAALALRRRQLRR